jgi:predicted alpha/beta-fold hydrolase
MPAISELNIRSGPAKCRNWLRALAGHFWTAVPGLIDVVRPRRLDGAIRLQTRIHDPVVGEITIRAEYNRVRSADSLVVIVHGITGNADSGPCVAAATAAVNAGCSAVRISMRGADGNGDDIHHAALTDDLKALLSMECFRRYRDIFLVGYSQGGNIVLRAASEHIDRRLAGVVSICPPLDLKAAMENFDRLGLRLYKTFMNARANALYAAVQRRRRARATLRELRQARTCSAWNELTIVPRFGFRDANHYYESAGMTGRWQKIRVPVLIAAAKHDPIIPFDRLRPRLWKLPANVRVECLDRGGHVYFPADISFGEMAPLGLEAQFTAWLIRQADRTATLERAG